MALLHSFRPDVISFEKAQKQSPMERLKTCFAVAESKCKIPALLDAEDIGEMIKVATSFKK